MINVDTFKKIRKINAKGLSEKIKLFFRDEYFKSPVATWLFFAAIAANAADWLTLRFLLRPVTSTVILHYNVYFGVDMMGDPIAAYWLPAIGLILLIINFLFSIYFYAKKERIATHILLMASLMIQLSLMVAIASVIIINY